MSDVGRIRDASRLCQKPEARAIVQRHRPEAQRRRHLREQDAYRRGRQSPNLPGDRGSIRRADHARPVAEGEQTIHRLGLRLPQEAAAERR